MAPRRRDTVGGAQNQNNQGNQSNNNAQLNAGRNQGNGARNNQGQGNGQGNNRQGQGQGNQGNAPRNNHGQGNAGQGQAQGNGGQNQGNVNRQGGAGNAGQANLPGPFLNQRLGGFNSPRAPPPPGHPNCRICNLPGHWESFCPGKAPNAHPQRCRRCDRGNHWEDECRQAGGLRKFLSPLGVDISHFFINQNGMIKLPARRACSVCGLVGHWDRACEKDGFHPETNPNPISLPRGQQAPTNQNQNQNQTHGNQSQQNQNQNQNQNQQAPGNQNPNQASRVRFSTPPGFNNGSPNPVQAPANFANSGLNPAGSNFNAGRPAGSFSIPDGLVAPRPDLTNHTDNICIYCKAQGHQDWDCCRFPWLFPREHHRWRPDPQSIAEDPNQQCPKCHRHGHGEFTCPNPAEPIQRNQFLRDQSRIPPGAMPDPGAILFPHPNNSYLGLPARETDADSGNWKVQYQNETDREGRGLIWRTAPTNPYGRESGINGEVQYDQEGDVVMIDILTWEAQQRQRSWDEQEKLRKRREDVFGQGTGNIGGFWGGSYNW